MNKITYKLTQDYIELIKLLKVLRLTDSGGMAKLLVEEGLVLCNGKVETRKRYKVKVGDIITYKNTTISVE